MPTYSDSSASAAVLERSGVRSRTVGRAMEQVTAALSKEKPSSSLVYAVVVYRKTHHEPKLNYLSAAGTFFKAYLRGFEALSRITHLLSTSPSRDHLRALEAKDFGDVRFYVGKATSKGVKQKVKPSPGIYIISSHLDADVLRNLRLPLLPKRLREIPLVIQVKNASLLMEKESDLVWNRWEKHVDVTTRVDGAETTIEKDTLNWRRRFMRENGCLTSEEIAQEGTSRATNRAAMASRWVKERKIFSVRFEGEQWFPRFQFQDGRPMPTISRVIEVFPEHATGWELAYFLSLRMPISADASQ